MALTHFLITRFNIVQSWYFISARIGRGTTIQTDAWLDNRFMLFERYCFPSVQAQSAQFTWLVLFNSETPQKYKERIAGYQKRMPNFVPLYLEPYGDETQIVKDYINNHCRTDTLLTTRMDNDDMLHADYLSYVQQYAPTVQCRRILNYELGYQYDVEMSTLHTMSYPSNHFFSVLEPFDKDYHTCLGMDHGKLSSYGEYVELDTNIGGGGRKLSIRRTWQTTDVSSNLFGPIQITSSHRCRKVGLTISRTICGTDYHIVGDGSVIK